MFAPARLNIQRLWSTRPELHSGSKLYWLQTQNNKASPQSLHICSPPQHMGGKSSVLILCNRHSLSLPLPIQETLQTDAPEASATQEHAGKTTLPQLAQNKGTFPATPSLLLIPHHTPTLGCALRGKATLGSICKRRDILVVLSITYSLGGHTTSSFLHARTQK